MLLDAKDKQGNSINWQADYCLLAVGRHAYTTGLNLEKIGIETNTQGAFRKFSLSGFFRANFCF